MLKAGTGIDRGFVNKGNANATGYLQCFIVDFNNVRLNIFAKLLRACDGGIGFDIGNYKSKSGITKASNNIVGVNLCS